MRRVIATLAVAVIGAALVPPAALAANTPPVAADDPAIPGCNPLGAFGGSYPIPEDWIGSDPSTPGWAVLWLACGALVNDTDADGDPLTISLVGQPDHGAAQVGADGILLYKADADFSTTAGDEPGGSWLSDAITYRAFDGQAYSNEASYRLWIAPVNDPPSFVAGAASVEAHMGDGAVSVPWATSISPGPPNEASQTVSFIVESVATGGASAMFASGPTIDAAGTLHFTPGSEPGIATVTIHAQDDGGLETYGLSAGTFVAPDDTSPSTSFSITIRPPDPAAPKAVDDNLSVSEDGSGSVDVLANDSDVNLDPLTVTGVSAAGHGTTAASSTPGRVEYAPDPDFAGGDSFTYSVGDGTGRSSTATVHVTVTPVNDPPVVTDDVATVPEGAGTTIDVLGNDDDVDGDTLTVTSASGSAHGTTTIVPGGVRYLPASGYVGPDAFSYSVSDGHGGTDSGTVSLTVAADGVTPVVSALATSVPAQTIGATSVLVRLSWSASDAGTGVATQRLEERVGTGVWHDVAVSSTARSATRRVTVGSSYRYRLTVTDGRGNATVASWGAFTARRPQESSGAITRSGTWPLVSDARYSGGAARRTTSTAARLTLTFSGRSVAWAATRSSTGGKAEVRIDGVLVATVSLRSTSREDRRVVFTRRLSTGGTHTLSIRPIGGRVDVDAFVILP